MSDLLRRITRRLNQASGSALIRALINARLQENANVLKLNIDPQQRTIEAEVRIKGQPEPLKLMIEGYELTSSGDQDQLRWSRLTVDGAAVNLPPGIRDKLSYVM